MSTLQLPRPGAAHRVFEKDVGDWDAAIELRPSPGAPAQRSEGWMSSRLVCGGLWLVSDFKNETSGFQGHGIYGHDPRRGVYVGVWIDPTRTFLTVGEGSWDEAGRTMTFRFEAPRPDGGVLRWRETTETHDRDTQVFRSFMPGSGGEFEAMIVTYRRRA
jgi:hypothetical protein